MSNAIPGHEFARESQHGPDGRAERGPAPQEEPISSYFALAGVFLGATTTALYALHRRRRPFPNPSPLDLLLLGLGTARLSRLITRDKVMRPLRAPFTAAETVAPGQVREQVKGGGLVRAVGELVTCPRCTAMWAANALSLTYIASPGAARYGAMVLSTSLISDVVNRSVALLDQDKK